MNCTNCGKWSTGDYCADCEQFRDRLEKLRAAQKQYWRDVASGKVKLPKPGRKHASGGASFRDQCLRYGKRLLAEGKLPTALPVSGQDAALPPGDRE